MEGVDRVFSIKREHIQGVSHCGTIHRTTFGAMQWPGTRFPLSILTDIGNGKPMQLQTVSLVRPVHGVYAQIESAHCVVVVDETSVQPQGVTHEGR